MKKIKQLLSIGTIALVGATFGTTAHNPAVSWFDKDYGDDVLELSNAQTPEYIRPGTTPNNSLVTVTAKMKLTAYQYGDEWETYNAIGKPKAAVAMRRHNEGDITFIGWTTTLDASYVKGRWVELAADGVEPAEDTEYAVGIEMDNSCMPTRVRYSVNNKKLKDSLGHEWFSIRTSLKPETYGSINRNCYKIGFVGRGEVSAVSGTYATTNRIARATIDMGEVARLIEGKSTITPVVTPNEGVTLGTLKYAWYLTDAALMRDDTLLSSEASYTVKAADAGHWITVDVSDENGFVATGKRWFSDLPTVYIEIDGDNKWPTAEKEDHTGTIRIYGNAEYADQLDGKQIGIDIHVRGNTTAGLDKKPYKLKLAKKYDVFGLGKNKHWVLLANFQDESLMRNKLAYDFSGKAGLVHMKSEWVDLVMNGQYVGNYLFCEHIRAGSDRINIFEWDTGTVAENALIANPALSEADQEAIDELLETNCNWIASGKFTYLGTNYTISTKKDYKGKANVDENGNVTVYWKDYTSDTTGGYIFELCHKKVPAEDGGITTGSQYWPMYSAFQQNVNGGKAWIHFDVAVNTPEFCFTDLNISNYVWNLWRDIGLAWTSGTGYHPDGRHYRDMTDIDSMMGYWITQFAFGNLDAGGHSRYAYLAHGDKVKFGPAWDFDHAAGSLQVRLNMVPRVYTNEYCELLYTPVEPRKAAPGTSTMNFMGFWTADPYFSYRLFEKYHELREELNNIVKEGGLIDQYTNKLAASARANDLRWNSRIGFFALTSDEPGDVDVLRDYLTRHFAWYDEQFTDTVGGCLTNVMRTACPSGLWFSRSSEVGASIAGSVTCADTIETEMDDITTESTNAVIAIDLSAPSAAVSMDIYVNGFSNCNVQVAEGKAKAELALTDLKRDERNFLSFSARNDQGAFIAHNAAFLTFTLPTAIAAEDGGHGVTLEWLDESWKAMVAANPSAFEGMAAPQTYAEYKELANQAPSPFGKATPLWSDFVAGTDPTNTASVFQSAITIGPSGLPEIAWEPDTPALRNTRTYKLYGKPSLGCNGWDSTSATDPDEQFLATNQFFKVEVDLP